MDFNEAMYYNMIAPVFLKISFGMGTDNEE